MYVWWCVSFGIFKYAAHDARWRSLGDTLLVDATVIRCRDHRRDMVIQRRSTTTQRRATSQLVGREQVLDQDSNVEEVGEEKGMIQACEGR